MNPPQELRRRSGPARPGTDRQTHRTTAANLSWELNVALQPSSAHVATIEDGAPSAQACPALLHAPCRTESTAASHRHLPVRPPDARPSFEPAVLPPNLRPEGGLPCKAGKLRPAAACVGFHGTVSIATQPQNRQGSLCKDAHTSADALTPPWRGQVWEGLQRPGVPCKRTKSAPLCPLGPWLGLDIPLRKAGGQTQSIRAHGMSLGRPPAAWEDTGQSIFCRVGGGGPVAEEPSISRCLIWGGGCPAPQHHRGASLRSRRLREAPSGAVR